MIGDFVEKLIYFTKLCSECEKPLDNSIGIYVLMQKNNALDNANASFFFFNLNLFERQNDWKELNESQND